MYSYILRFKITPGMHSYQLFVLLSITVCCQSSSFSKLRRSPDVYLNQERRVWSHDSDPQILYYKQQVDHFGFANPDTYLQRYLVFDKYWDKNGGPIFFYTGNEGDIVWFYNNTGLLFDWAPDFKALIVFAEHRYYGESMPYGNDSYKDPKHLDYLTSEQALADFAVLIDYLKHTIPGAANSSVVAFGGSYGGMLSAWMRIKYPQSIVGALAASAPIWLFGDLVPCNTFNQIVSNDFQKSGPNCADNIRKSWKVITNMASSGEGRQKLQQIFGLCKPLTAVDGSDLKGWLSETWVNLAMVDYPYPANFLEPLPAWPIKTVCSSLKDKDVSDLQLMKNVRDAINVYFNYTGTASCFDISEQAASSLGDLGWDYQSCTEMVMPTCSDGVTDMFENIPWNLAEYVAGCQKRWNVTPRPDWILNEYGGKNIQASSNIIFSNGKLDPWSAGGVLTTLTDNLVAILIEDGAHHLDLRSTNPDDPPSVIQARKIEKEIVRDWIHQGHSQKLSEYDRIVIVQSYEGFMSDTKKPKTEGKSVSFLENAFVFALFALVFFAVLALVGFSGSRRQSTLHSSFRSKDNVPLL